VRVSINNSLQDSTTAAPRQTTQVLARADAAQHSLHAYRAAETRQAGHTYICSTASDLSRTPDGCGIPLVQCMLVCRQLTWADYPAHSWSSQSRRSSRGVQGCHPVVCSPTSGRDGTHPAGETQQTACRSQRSCCFKVW
jgi:hypothetical protein